MIGYIFIGIAIGGSAMLAYAVWIGSRNRGQVSKMFARSAALGVYCAMIRRGDDDPDVDMAMLMADHFVASYKEADDE